MEAICTKLLLERLSKSDEEAFRLIYEQYWSKLYNLCYYYTHSREDTEDIVMDIFLALWKNRKKIHIENIDHYLVKAAKNQSLKYIQKKQRQQSFTQQFKEKSASAVVEGNAPDKVLEKKELSLYIEGQIQLLPEKTRRIFQLNRENGLTYQQIAKSLGISEKSVEYHVSKALRVLTSRVFILLLLLTVNFIFL